MKPLLPLAAILVLAGAPDALLAQNWPRFRGTTDGVAADHPALPDRWSTTENVVWKTDIPGRGWSSPVVWGDHVFVVTAIDVAKPVETFRAPTEYVSRSFGGPSSGEDVNRTASEHRWVVYDVDANTGKVRWERVLRTATSTQPGRGGSSRY